MGRERFDFMYTPDFVEDITGLSESRLTALRLMAQIMVRYPEIRMGQMISNLRLASNARDVDYYYVKDEEIVEGLRHVLQVLDSNREV